MGDIPAALLVHTVQVEAYEGSGAFGDVYADAADLACFADRTTKVERVAGGHTRIRTATLFARLDEVVPVGSRVTFTDGVTAVVVETLPRDGGGLPTPDHLEIRCA